MDKFSASFRFYEAGAPYPGICLKCGAGSKLWDLGRNISGTNMGAYYCDGCLVELATYTGMVQKDVFSNTITKIQEDLDKTKAQLEVAPKLIKELTHDITSILGEFVSNLASVPSSNKSVQPKGAKANTGDSGEIAEESRGDGKAAAEVTKPSSKSSK
jgi:hypothetical protein